MSEEKKYPKVVVGVYIFNDKSELFLMAHRYWQNKFTIPGGHVEIGEKFEETVKREVKEETNLDIEDIEFLGFRNLPDLKTKFTGPVNHLVSFFYKVKAKGDQKVTLNEEGGSFKWQTIEEWLKQKEEVTDSTIEPITEYFTNNESEKDYKNLYKRALADYQNLLKQTAKEKMEFAVYANEQMLKEILPVYDHLKLALEHHNGESNDDWLKGVEYVVKQFKNALEKIGVEEILVPTEASGKVKDKKFDHNLMDAIQSEETEDEKLDGLVARQVKAGYRLNGKVIEPAKVIVYKIKNDK